MSTGSYNGLLGEYYAKGLKANTYEVAASHPLQAPAAASMNNATH